MSKIFIEVSDGIVQGVFTNLKNDVEVIICDHDNAEREIDGDGFNFQDTKACEKLEDNIEELKQIF